MHRACIHSTNSQQRTDKWFDSRRATTRQYWQEEKNAFEIISIYLSILAESKRLRAHLSHIGTCLGRRSGGMGTNLYLYQSWEVLWVQAISIAQIEVNNVRFVWFPFRFVDVLMYSLTIIIFPSKMRAATQNRSWLIEFVNNKPHTSLWNMSYLFPLPQRQIVFTALLTAVFSILSKMGPPSCLGGRRNYNYTVITKNAHVSCMLEYMLRHYIVSLSISGYSLWKANFGLFLSNQQHIFDICVHSESRNSVGVEEKALWGFFCWR